MSDVMGGSMVNDPRAEHVPYPDRPGWEAHHHMAATPVDVEVKFPDGKVARLKGLYRSYRNTPGGDEGLSHPGWTEWQVFGQIGASG